MRRSVWPNIFPERSVDRRDSRPALGWGGEALAARYLESRGYRILHRNWRGGGQHAEELDLIAEDGDGVVFVEVKTRSGPDFGPPEEAVTVRKREHLRRAAQEYLSATGREAAPYRIDVIAICPAPGGGRTIMRHFRSAVGEAD